MVEVMLWVSIIYFILPIDETRFQFFTGETLCEDITMNYVLRTDTYVIESCKPFDGTREQYIKEFIDG